MVLASICWHGLFGDSILVCAFVFTDGVHLYLFRGKGMQFSKALIFYGQAVVEFVSVKDK